MNLETMAAVILMGMFAVAGVGIYQENVTKRACFEAQKVQPSIQCQPTR